MVQMEELLFFLSYKKSFGVGIGVGFSEYPGGLKSNAVVGDPLPSDIKDLEELIDHKRRVSGFITFSISGITVLNR